MGIVYAREWQWDKVLIENIEITKNKLREIFIFHRSLSQINFALEIEIRMTLEGAFSKSKMESSFFFDRQDTKNNCVENTNFKWVKWIGMNRMDR